MNKQLQSIVSQYTEQQDGLNSIVVTSFANNNGLTVGDGFLSQYYDPETAPAPISTIENVVNIFELAIPQTEKTKNGAVYTPRFIRDYILNRVIALRRRNIQDCLSVDAACGCGAFLYSLADYMHTHCGITYRDCVHRLYGVDISALSVSRCKILLALAALQYGEDLQDEDFNIHQGNSLSFDFLGLPGVADNGGFDIVVGNPPYVRSKHIDAESKSLLPLWSVARGGNADLYIPFFEIGVNILRPDGVLGYITLNSFFKSVNARSLRRYFSEHNCSIELVDFGAQLVFEKKLAYTCIAVIDKQGQAGVHYTQGNISAQGFATSPEHFNTISYESLNDHKGWNLNRDDVLLNIRKIEGTGKSLGESFPIRNGIATLANDVYIFRPVSEDSLYYYLVANGLRFPIEKGICRDIIKPNILHSEKEISSMLEKVIFPYDSGNNLLPEAVLISQYPFAYKYLSLNKVKLAQRDKGEKEYGAWYAFGRTQAVNDRGLKLLFPYMTDHPHFVYTDNANMLIYCGYAIFSDKEEDLLVLKRILESSVFDYYMRHTAKPYASGYYSYAKNYVKGFGLPALDPQQRKKILSLQSPKEIDDYIESLYNVRIA